MEAFSLISITILACVNKKDVKFQNYSSFCLCKRLIQFTLIFYRMLHKINNNEEICYPTIMQNPRKKLRIFLFKLVFIYSSSTQCQTK